MLTIVAPTGVDAKIDTRIPTTAQMTESTAEHTITARKVLNRRIADNAGKIIRAEIKSEPTRFIASTITNAVISAIKRLYKLVRNPVAWAKVSSKVTAKIL